MYYSTFHSHLIYGIQIYSCVNQTNLNSIILKQKQKAIRCIKNARYNAHTGELFKNLKYIRPQQKNLYALHALFYIYTSGNGSNFRGTLSNFCKSKKCIILNVHYHPGSKKSKFDMTLNRHSPFKLQFMYENKNNLLPRSFNNLWNIRGVMNGTFYCVIIMNLLFRVFA